MIYNDTIFVVENKGIVHPEIYQISKLNLQGDSIGVWKYHYTGYYELPVNFIQKSGFFYLLNWHRIDDVHNKIEFSKIDGNGNMLFTKVIQKNPVNAVPTFSLTKDGNFLATYMYGVNGTTSVILKIDTLGNILWTKKDYDENSTFDYFSRAIELDDGSIVYNTKYEIMDFDSLYYLGLKQRPNVIKKISQDGKTQLWKLQMDFPQSDNFGIEDIYHAENNDIIGAGINKTIDSLIINDTLRYYTRWNGWLFRINPEGQLLWQRQYIDKINFKINRFYDVVSEVDGDIVLCGSIIIEDSTWNDNDMSWILRLDKDGCFSPGCSETDSIVYITSQVIDIPDYLPRISIYPNPAHEYINMKVPDGFKIYKWRIFDINGRVLLHGDSNKDRINISLLESGMYFIQIKEKAGFGNMGKIAIGKFILE